MSIDFDDNMNAFRSIYGRECTIDLSGINLSIFPAQNDYQLLIYDISLLLTEPVHVLVEE